MYRIRQHIAFQKGLVKSLDIESEVELLLHSLYRRIIPMDFYYTLRRPHPKRVRLMHSWAAGGGTLLNCVQELHAGGLPHDHVTETPWRCASSRSAASSVSLLHGYYMLTTCSLDVVSTTCSLPAPASGHLASDFHLVSDFFCATMQLHPLLLH